MKLPCWRHINPKSNNPGFVRHVFTLLSGSVLAQAIPLAVYPLVTRLYTPAAFGLFATFMTYAGVLGAASALRYEQAILLPARHDTAFKVFKLAIGATAITGMVAFLFVSIAGGWFAGITGMRELREYLWLLPLAGVATGLFHTFSFRANRFQKYRTMAGSSVMQSGTSSAIKVGVGWGSAHPAGLIWSYIAGHGIAAIYLWRKVRASGKIQLPGKSEWLKLLHLARHYRYFPFYDMPQVVLFSISGNLPVIVFTRYFSEAQAGFYALAFAVVFRPLSVLARAMHKVLAEKYIQLHNKGQPIYPALKKMAFRMFLVAIPLAFAAGWAAPPVVSWVFGNDWALVGTYLQILLPLLVSIFLETVFDFLPNMFFQQKKVLWISLLYFALRLLSLAAGVWLNQLITGLILFSATGALVKAASLMWYLHLAKRHDVQAQ